MSKKEKQEKMIKLGINPKSWIFNATKKELEECICNEWDGKGVSCCGVPCPVHSKPAKRIPTTIKKYGRIYRLSQEDDLNMEEMPQFKGTMNELDGLVSQAHKLSNPELINNPLNQ